MLKLVSLLISISLTAVAVTAIKLPPPSAATQQAQESLYLPNGQALEVASLGFRNVAAHILWFRTVLYFGYHVKRDRDYRWLAHMCELVTKLNPSARYVYEFGGVLLAWEAKDPAGGVAILSKGIEVFPEYWKLYFLRGILRFYFLKQDAEAQEDFSIGAKLPDAPVVLAQMAAKKMSKLGNATMAVKFLDEMLANTSDSGSREALQRSLNEAIARRDAEFLTQGITIFSERLGRLPQSFEELVSEKVISKVPSAPPGISYHMSEDRTAAEWKKES